MEAIASVPNYEEHTDQTGHIVTYYLVVVEWPAKKLRYTLYKRYSEFATLFALLKERYPAVEAFKFPNKSMFNTHSQFTKERRRVAFDDFCKMLLTLDSKVPQDIEDFLEIKGHIAKQQQAPNGPGAALNARKEQDGLPSRGSGDQLSSMNDGKFSDSKAPMAPPQRATNLEPQLVDRIKRADGGSSSTALGSHRRATVNEIVRGQMPSIVRSTLLVTIVLYFGLIYLGVIDTSSTTNGRKLVTVISLTSLFTFIRILLLRRSVLQQHGNEDNNNNNNNNKPHSQ